MLTSLSLAEAERSSPNQPLLERHDLTQLNVNQSRALVISRGELFPIGKL